jgi:CBS domain-containing protein
VDLAAARLADGAAVLVIDNGHPTGILTRSDLLDFLSGADPERDGVGRRAGLPPRHDPDADR